MKTTRLFLRALTLSELLALILIFTASAEIRAAQTRVVMKDGRLYVGAIFPTKSVVETTETKKEKDSAPVQSEKILVVDDQLRRIYVPKNATADLILDDSGSAMEVFKISQRVNENPNEKIAVLGSYRALSDFDEFGRRVILASGTQIVQGVTEIAPSYVRVQGLTHNLDMRLSPHSIPRATLTALIKKQIDPKSLDDRLRIYQFYVQASLYEQAAEELQEIMSDFEGDEEADRLDSALRLIKQLAAERLLDELELRRASGQHRKVKELLAAFEADRVSPEKLQAIRRMRRLYEEEDAKRERIIGTLNELLESIDDEELKQVAKSIVVEITKELNSNTLGRFAAFEQAEKDNSLQDSQKLAVALSGWLVGNIGSDDHIENAVSMYRARQLARRYLLETRPIQRDELWKQIQEEEASSPQILAKILATMKPPKSPPRSTRDKPYFYELSVPSFQDGKSFVYSVQLPPEYDPNRKYPAILTLHGERSTPIQQLNWWCGPWVEKTNAQGKKVFERYGQASRFGYIVIAPQWLEGGRKEYDFSASVCANVLYCLRDASRTFSIDTDRVYISGFQSGGDVAWDVALAHPDLWAGCIPICGAASYLTPLLKRNGAYVPLYAIGGELDGGKLAASRETLDWGMDLSKPFDMTYVQFKGRGSEPFPEETTRVFDWASMKTRRFYSQEEKVVYSIRPWDNFFWSTELFEFPEKSTIDPLFPDARAKNYRPAKTEFFKIVDNSLRIRSSADRGVIFLSPEQIDFDRKMEVVFNGKKLTPQNGMVPASARVMLEDARTRVDRQHPFWASVNSKLPGKYNEWEN